MRQTRKMTNRGRRPKQALSLLLAVLMMVSLAGCNLPQWAVRPGFALSAEEEGVANDAALQDLESEGEDTAAAEDGEMESPDLAETKDLPENAEAPEEDDLQSEQGETPEAEEDAQAAEAEAEQESEDIQEPEAEPEQEPEDTQEPEQESEDTQEPEQESEDTQEPEQEPENAEEPEDAQDAEDRENAEDESGILGIFFSDPEEEDENDENSAEEKTLTAEGDNYTVTATFGPDAGIPENAELKVERVDPKTKEYKQHAEEAEAKLNEEQGIPAAEEAGKDSKTRKSKKAEEADGIPVEIVEPTYDYQIFDICFVADGQEIEPNDKVQVQLSFKDKEFANTESATVVHLDEKEGAEILEEQTIEADKKGNVTASFASDAFSIYVLANPTSAPDQGDGDYVLLFNHNGTQYAMTKNGTAARVDYANNIVTTASGSNVSEADITWNITKDGDVYRIENGNDYVYSTYVAYPTGHNNVTTTDTNQNRVAIQNGNIVTYYSNHTVDGLCVGFDENRASNGYLYPAQQGTNATPITFTFAKVGQETSNAQPIQTEDTYAKGVQMWLFDYDITNGLPDHTLDDDGNTVGSPDETNDSNSINHYSDLYFLGWGSGGNETNPGINDFTGLDENGNNKISVVQGIVQKELPQDANGNYTYPVLNITPSSGKTTSLAYLFDPTANTVDRKVYGGTDGNVTNLFRLDGGFYKFDSNNNYAYLGSDNKTFTVMDRSITQTDKNGNTHTPPRAVGFFPFNTYDEMVAYKAARNNAGKSNVLYLNPDRSSKSGVKDLNHHLGVAMKAEFLLPEDGLDDNGQPIVYNFSGDDDMWVFVDGKLILDLGGIHQPTQGSINFETGEVLITGNNTSSTTSPNVGNDAVKVASGIVDTDTVGGSYNMYDKNLLQKDGKSHTIQIFYMERGGCDSNCKIEFNLPIVLGKGDVTVAKQESADTAPEGKRLKGVKFGVYSDAECQNLIEEVTSDNNGLLLFEKLAIQREGQTYYLKETQPLPGYKPNESTYTLIARKKSGSTREYTFDVKKGDQTLGTVGSNPAYPVIYNEKEPPSDVVVEKVWRKANGEPMTAEEIAAIPGIENVTVSGKLKQSWMGETQVPYYGVTVNLRVKDKNGWQSEQLTKVDPTHSFKFTVKGYWISDSDGRSTTVNGGNTTVTAEDDGQPNRTRTFTVGNMPSTGEITIEINFTNRQSSFTQGIRLVDGPVYVPDGTPTTGTAPQTREETFTLDNAHDWSYVFQQIKEDASVEYTYTWENISENPTASGYQFFPTPVDKGYITDEEGEVSTRLHSFTLGNQKTATPTDLTVNKVWSDGNNNHTDQNEQIKYKIKYDAYDKDGNLVEGGPYYYIERGEDETKEYTLSYSDVYSGDHWKKRHENLPADNAEDPDSNDYREYRYSVEETEVPEGYIVSYSGSQDGKTQTIRNQKKGPVSVEKKWVKADGTTPLTDNLPESITGTLKRRKKDISSAVTVSIRVKRGDDVYEPVQPENEFVIQKNTGFKFWFRHGTYVPGIWGVSADDSSAVQITRGQDVTVYPDPSNTGWTIQAPTYQLSNVTKDVTITIDIGYNGDTGYFIGFPTQSDEPQEPTGTSGDSWTEDSGFSKDFTLSASSFIPWRQDWTADQLNEQSNYLYEYYVTENTSSLPDGYSLVGITSDDDHKDFTITNKKLTANLVIHKQKHTFGPNGQPSNEDFAGVEFELKKGSTVIDADHNTDQTDANGLISYSNLSNGDYTLTETPQDGFMAAGPWSFTVKDGEITPAQGTENFDLVTTGSDSNNYTFTYKIINTELYELPEAGGPGTYLFTIGGAAILFTALLLWIKPYVRKEEWTET